MLRTRLTVTVMLAALLPAAPASAQRYTFTVLEDNTGDFEAFEGAAINDGGAVAFAATLRAGGAGVYRHEGPTLPLTTIVESPLLEASRPLGIDAGGRVVLELQGQIVRGDGLALTPLADASQPVPFGDDPTVPCGSVFPAGDASNAGGLVPVACTPGSGVGLYLAGGAGGVARVCDSSLDAAGVARFPFCGFGDAELSPNGTLALVVSAQRDQPWLNAIATGPPDALAIALDDGTGATGEGMLGGVPLERFEGVAVNDAGTVLFGALVRDVPTRVGKSLYVQEAGALRRITPFVDPLDPSARGLLEPRAPAINNAGTIVFEAAHKVDAAATVRGVYTGPDPELDKVVAVGDVIPGLGAVTALSLGGMNEAGAIVLVVASGALQAVVRADPVAPPPPPQATIDLAPPAAERPAGSSHTVVATVTVDGAPRAGVLVQFTVTGPNAGADGGCAPCTTDEAGQVAFTYTSDGTPGEDELVASATLGTVAFSASARASWTPAVETACSVLGDTRKPWSLDVDLFGFRGRADQRVTIRLAPDAAGTHTGERATLILLDRVRGLALFRVDGGALPNVVHARLPADGDYVVIVAGQPWWFRGRAFRGDYCLSIETSAPAPPALRPTASLEP
jgi:hypothetical protein